jgi:hypothetical protein
MTFRWLRNGTNLIGQTNAMLLFKSAQPWDSGSYNVVIANALGRATSVIGRLDVNVGSSPAQPLALTGWNWDMILENTSKPYSQHWISMFEAGFRGWPDGLPTSRRFTSAVDGKVIFEFQPYTSSNDLRLAVSSAAARTKTLTLTTPLKYSKLYVLAACEAGSADGQMVVNFTDGTSSTAIKFLARDWWAGTSEYSASYPTRRPAIAGLGRTASMSYQNGQYGFEFHQTDVDLTAIGLDTKAIRSLTFTMPVVGADVMHIWAVSGEAVPSGVFTGLTRLWDGTVLISFTGDADTYYRFEASENLLDWTPFVTLRSSTGSLQFVDPAAAWFPMRFYRTVEP